MWGAIICRILPGHSGFRREMRYRDEGFDMKSSTGFPREGDAIGR
jgi:hypothetical protein